MLMFQGTPIIFSQERVGVNKIPFKLFKLRTMENGEVTTIGKILRKTGIDEIPQLLNIIKGDMNFIGPRPLTKQDVTRLSWEGQKYSLRWKVKPGLSGLAQLSPICDKRVSFLLDKHFVENNSGLLQLKIFVASLFIPITGKRRIQKLFFKR